MSDERITEALDYERLTVAKRSEELRRQTEKESAEWRSRFAKHGHTGWSSPMVVKLLELQVERLRALVQAACEVRREMCKKVPELGSPEMLASLQEELHGRIRAEQNHIPHAVAALVGGPSEEPRIHEIMNFVQFETTLLLMRGDMERELKRIEQELSLGIHAPEPRPSITVNIGSMVGALNLGTVTGDMNTNLTSLEREGTAGQELAQLLKRLTEAIARADALSEEIRADVIESVAAITQEASLPPDKRKRHVVQALLAHIGPIVSTAAQVAEVWSAVQPTITSWFGH